MTLLNKQAVHKHLYKRLTETAINNVGVECDASDVFEEIATDRIRAWLDEVQPVDAEPVRHGKWIATSLCDHVACSNCLKTYDWYTQAQYINFCPNCGAKMDGERKEE